MESPGNENTQEGQTLHYHGYFHYSLSQRRAVGWLMGQREDLELIEANRHMMSCSKSLVIIMDCMCPPKFTC